MPNGAGAAGKLIEHIVVQNSLGHALLREGICVGHLQGVTFVPKANCLNCVVNPWVGCRACGWKMCEPCRRGMGFPWVNRAVHREVSPTCSEARDVDTNFKDWPSFFLNPN